MKKYYLLSALLFIAYTNGLAQSMSAPMNFHIEKEVIPPVLSIIPESFKFEDLNKNGVIDAQEQCKIRFQVSNTGRGDGYGCVAKVNAQGDTQDIKFSDISLPVIPKLERVWVEIPIIAGLNTITGEVNLNIFVDEPNGYGTEQITSTIGTHKLKTPFVKVASYNVLGGGKGILERRKSFKLQVAVQNVDQGVADNVEVDIQLPKNVGWNGGDEQHLFYYNLQPGETKKIEYELIANQNADENIVIGINLKEKQGKYAENLNIPLQFGQHVSGLITQNVDRKDFDVEIKQASLISSVDSDIPVSRDQNKSTFVVIIANENYLTVAPVPFALNDGKVFQEYCVKTLGIPEKNIKYVPNATGNILKAQIQWLENITNVFDEPNIIFYYAGHGIPDESSKTAYLLPIDGLGTDVTTGYKLDDLYDALGHMPSSHTTIFLDACFSGSKREDGMLASARGVAIKSKAGVPQGNMVVFSAAQGDETAYPNKEEGHGMFTYYLLKKLQETKGDVTLKDLGDYITTNVRQQSIVLNSKSQTPCVTPSSNVADSWQSWKLK